jgi:hypothetical protein
MLRGGERRLRAARESALPPFSVSLPECHTESRPECHRQAIRSASEWPREAGISGVATHTSYSGRVQVRRAYKFRAYPTRPREGRAARLLADHCDL